MGNCTNCTESCACCEYVDIPDKCLWQEIKKPNPRVWKIQRLLRRNGASPNSYITYHKSVSNEINHRNFLPRPI